MIEGFKRILLPVDFSEQGDAALEYALWFARMCNATFHLAHVVSNPADPIYEPPDQVHWVMLEKAKEKAAVLVEEIAGKYLPPTCPRQIHVEVGDPFAKLMELAREIEPDLVVMATRGRGGVAHLVLGSVAEKMVRMAPCPVFVVRQRMVE
jgi:nucleotide-binding universal stress UspA family protein